jgi:hypothetical protein
MKYTNLELVQAILSSTDGEEVNDIDETVESSQVVESLKTVLNDMVTRGDIASTKTPFTLVASGDNTKPTLMTKPDGIANIDYIKYNCIGDDDEDPIWQDITYLPLNDFIDYMHGYLPSEDNVGTFDQAVDAYTITFHYKDDAPPRYYTVVEDNTIIFDSYDSEVDTTLQSVKTLAFGGKDFSFVRTNTWVAPLEADQFALYLNEAKALVWMEQKQSAHPKAEQAARRNWQHLARTRRTTPSGRVPAHQQDTAFNSLPNFSRK